MRKALLLKCLFFFLIKVYLFVQTCADLDVVTLDGIDVVLSTNKYVLVVFTKSEACPQCKEATTAVEKLITPENLDSDLVKKESHDLQLAGKYGVQNLPKLLFYRDGIPALYDGETFDIEEISLWLEPAQEIATKELNEDSFEHLTQAATGATTGDWFVVFYGPNMEQNEQIFPAVESMGIRVKQRMNVASVDAVVNPKLAKRFKLKKLPTSIYFRQGKMYEYEPEKYEPKTLVSFVSSWYTNVQARKVPGDPTAFDLLTESIAMQLKEYLQDPNKKLLFIAVTGAVSCVIVIAVFIVCCMSKPKAEKVD